MRSDRTVYHNNGGKDDRVLYCKILVVRHQTIVVMSLMKYLDVFRIMIIKTAIYPQSTRLFCIGEQDWMKWQTIYSMKRIASIGPNRFRRVLGNSIGRIVIP